MDNKDIVKDDAKAHWKWVKELLMTQGIDKRSLSLAGYLYITAFIHGAKHSDSGSYGVK